MRFIILISLLFATSTLGGITYIGNSVNWNPYIHNILEIGSNSQTDSHTTTPLIGLGSEVHVKKVTSSDLRRQSIATNNAELRGILYAPEEPVVGSGTWCVQEKILPTGQALKDAYIAADHILEIQVISEMMADANIELGKNYDDDQLDDLKTTINAQENVAYIPYEFNCAKAVVIRKFVKKLVDTSIPEQTKCAAMGQGTTAELKVYLSRFCPDILTTAGTVTDILKNPISDVGMNKDKVDVFKNVVFMLDCMGVTVEEGPQGVFTCNAPVVPC